MTSVIRAFQDRSLEIVKPKSLASVTTFMHLPRWQEGNHDLLKQKKCKVSYICQHLVWLFLLDQSVTSSAIVCALLTCPFLISSDVVVSSTYFQSDALLIARLLTMIKNNHGPSLVPWGTPEGTAPHSDTAFREFDFLRAAWKEIYDPISNARWNFLTKLL